MERNLEANPSHETIYSRSPYGLDIKTAIIWQLQHLVKNLTNIKFFNAAQLETDKIFDKAHGEDYRKYLVKILFKEIDFQSRQKETARVNLLKPNLEKLMLNPYFLDSYVFELFSEFSNLLDTYENVIKQLKLKPAMQLLFCLGIYTFYQQSKEAKSLKILKQKLKEWFEYEKEGELPSYAVYHILKAIKSEKELSTDSFFSQNVREYLIQQNLKATKEDSLQALNSTTGSLYKYEMDLKNNSDFKFVEKCSNTYQILEPWQVLVDLGPGCSHYEYDVLADIIKDFTKTSLRGRCHTLIAMSNHFVAQDNELNLEVITMKCNLKGDMTFLNQHPEEYPVSSLQWNLEALAKALSDTYSPSDSWCDLIKFLDVDLDAREEFYFQSLEAFTIFMKLWSMLKPQNKSFPVEFLIANSWKNKRAQTICLDYAIAYSYNTPDILFEKAKRRLDPQGVSQSLKIDVKPATATYARIWKCIDLVQTLLNLSESPYYYRIRRMFDPVIKYIPEYLLLTLTKTKAKMGKFLYEDLCSALLPQFLMGHTNSVPILGEIWSTDKNLVISYMADLYRKNPKKMTLSRVLDISQNIKNSIFEIITLTDDYNFALQLVMLGAKQDSFLHFEHWIKKLIDQEGDPFVNCLLKYVDQNLITPASEVGEDKKKVEKILDRCHLTEEKLSMIYENLHKKKEDNPEALEYDTLQKLSESFSKVVKLFPNIHIEQSNNEEIEERANEYFQQLYKGEKQVEDLIKIMKDFRSSPNPTERETFACMVQNLFDEWKFFPKYPKKELWMTARLFGKIISEKKIIDGVVTDIGLKCLVEGLKREGKMFDFAITALEECKDSIDKETGLKNILICKQLQEKKPELYEYINNRYNEMYGEQQKAPEDKGPVPPMPNPQMRQNEPRQENPVRMQSPNVPQTMPTVPKRMGMQQHMNTPTQPGKYFTPEQNPMGWKGTGQPMSGPGQQMPGSRMIFPPNQQRSARQPFQDAFSLGPSADSVVNPSSLAAGRALNLKSKGFKPKTQQVQEYLKKDDVINLPADYLDELTTILNMTGTEQILKKAQELEEQTKEEYIDSMAHFIVVKRVVVDADEKRIEFYSNFFHCMKNRKIIKALISECVATILRIIITESSDPNNKSEVTRAAMNPIRNLASFLGNLTLAQNQALLSSDFDLKKFLLEGYKNENRCMGLVVIAVCKILRTAESSRFFTPYNPWVNSLYGMLLEYKNFLMNPADPTSKVISNEILLVMKNARMALEHVKQSTLFRSFQNGDTQDRELAFIVDKIEADPYIVFPKIPIQPVQTDEDSKQEVGEQDPSKMLFSFEHTVIDEVSKKFPTLDMESLKMLAHQGINHAMREIIEAVIKRVIPIASITTRILVLKDFALEPSPAKLSQAASSTAKSLAGMLAQITVKDILRFQFAKSLKDLVSRSNNQGIAKLDDEAKKELIETVIKENSELGCSKIINAVQKEALKSISKDDSIIEAIAKREKYQKDGTDFKDLSAMTNHNRLPEILKPNPNGLTDAEFQVYEDFDGIQDMVESVLDDEPSQASQNQAEAPPAPVGTQEQQILNKKFVTLCYTFASNEISAQSMEFKREISEIRKMMEQIPDAQEYLTENLLNQKKPVALNAHLIILLIENKIISLSSWHKRFSFYLKQAVENTNDHSIIDFLETFVIRGMLQQSIVKESQITELVSCIKVFSQAKNNPNSVRWKSILHLFSIQNDPTNIDVFEELGRVYFDQWVNAPDLNAFRPSFCYKIKVVFKYSQHMEMFIRQSLITALETLEVDEEEEDFTFDFSVLDRFIHMIIGCSFNWVQQNAKSLNVIDESQALNVVGEVLYEYHMEKLDSFNQIPFKRIIKFFMQHFVQQFQVVQVNDIDLTQKHDEILLMFANLLKTKLNPRMFPAFAFSWLELISSKNFMPAMLRNKTEFNTAERWLKLHELFNELFSFLKENIYENSPSSPALEKFFEGTLKLCLVVLHDYPEFFYKYYFEFINHLPLYRTGNLRNMILAAYPKNIRLPDPHAEIIVIPDIVEYMGQDRQTLLQNYVDEGDYYGLKADLDNYLQTNKEELLISICERLENAQVVKNNRRIINTGIVHSTMLYLATEIEEKGGVEELSDPALAKKFMIMCQTLSTPARDILLNAMFNELRALSKATVYFVNVLMTLFTEIDMEENITSKQIARILIGRIRLPKIHPWGLLCFKNKISKTSKFKMIQQDSELSQPSSSQ